MVFFEAGLPKRFEEDSNGDGRPDVRGELDAAGETLREARDTTGDGQYDVRVAYTGGQRTRKSATPGATASTT